MKLRNEKENGYPSFFIGSSYQSDLATSRVPLSPLLLCYSFAKEMYPPRPVSLCQVQTCPRAKCGHADVTVCPTFS